MPDLCNERANTSQCLRVAIVLVLEEPGTLPRARHIGSNQHPMMKGKVPEVFNLAAVRWEGLAFKPFKIDKLGFVNV